jgi:molybdate transport system regulatory protein
LCFSSNKYNHNHPKKPANTKLNSTNNNNETINMPTLRFENKLWMVNEKDEAVFGNGIAEILEEIDTHHSILEASNHLGMSYRYALHRLTLAEARLGESLVTRVRGGAKGGGSSQVTDFGRNLVKRYRNAQVELDCKLKKMP